MKLLLSIVLGCLLPFNLWAQNNFSLKISTPDSVVALQQAFQLNLEFTNDSLQYASIAIPRSEQAIHAFSIQYFEKINNEYVLYYKEPLLKDSVFLNYINAKVFTLSIGEQANWPLFVNDSVHYSFVPESKHKLELSKPKELYVKVVYDPTYLFVGAPDSSSYRYYKTNEQNMALQKPILESNYLKINFVEQSLQKKSKPKTKFCKAIEREKWGRVYTILNRKTKRASKKDTPLDKPLCIAAEYYYPDAILSSLPSYSSNIIVFKNSNGYHFFTAHYQLGKIYWASTAIYGVNSLFKTNLPASNHKAVKLIKLIPANLNKTNFWNNASYN